MARIIQRKCKCSVCFNEWTDMQYFRKGHQYPVPDCPECLAKGNNAISIKERDDLAEMIKTRTAPSVGSRVASRAGDYALKMLEEDYGIPPSLMNDNMKQGDNFVKVPERKDAPEVKYMANVKNDKEVIDSFLAGAKAHGGLGESGNLTGIDILQGAAKAGKIPNPLTHSQFIHAKD